MFIAHRLWIILHISGHCWLPVTLLNASDMYTWMLIWFTNMLQYLNRNSIKLGNMRRFIGVSNKPLRALIIYCYTNTFQYNAVTFYIVNYIFTNLIHVITKTTRSSIATVLEQALTTMYTVGSFSAITNTRNFYK